jgi:hypothetical protein
VSENWPMHVFGLIGCFVLAAMLFVVGMAEQNSRMQDDACGTACRKANGGMHDADGSWCVCKSGLALKYDVAGLYRRVEGK